MKNVEAFFVGILGATVAFMGVLLQQNIKFGKYEPTKKEISKAVTEQPTKTNDLIHGKGYKFVKTTCTACHSHTLITKLRKNREGWQDLLVWMQFKQGLRALSPKEEKIILDYLEKNYGLENSKSDKSQVVEYGKTVSVYRRPPLPQKLMPEK